MQDVECDDKNGDRKIVRMGVEDEVESEKDKQKSREGAEYVQNIDDEYGRKVSTIRPTMYGWCIYVVRMLSMQRIQINIDRADKYKKGQAADADERGGGGRAVNICR